MPKRWLFISTRTVVQDDGSKKVEAFTYRRTEKKVDGKTKRFLKRQRVKAWKEQNDS